MRILIIHNSKNLNVRAINKNYKKSIVKKINKAAKLLDDKVECAREEKVFRMWINSLGLNDDNGDIFAPKMIPGYMSICDNLI